MALDYTSVAIRRKKRRRSKELGMGCTSAGIEGYTTTDG